MVVFRKGHKNSKGEKAEWCIVSHETGKILSSHKSKDAAKSHLDDMRKFKHMKENNRLEWAVNLLQENNYICEKTETEFEYGPDSLVKYLNDSLRAEKLGTAWYDGNSIKITDINRRLTICDIFFDEDDFCVNQDDRCKWFSDTESQRKDAKKYIESLIKKLDKD